uniref:Uncharacterized protein n=1 Tax=Arundo donax TaxID=35708 RepID=A0A0A8ZA39_ARUDO
MSLSSFFKLKVPFLSWYYHSEYQWSA